MAREVPAGEAASVEAVRSRFPALERRQDGVPVAYFDGPGGTQVPLEQLADIKVIEGPSMLRDENGFLAGYVYVDIAGRDVGGYVEEAKKAVAKEVALPPGYVLQWSGQYENMLRVRERLKLVVPLTVFVIFLLLYMNTGSGVKAAIPMRIKWENVGIMTL